MTKSLGTLWYFPIQKCIRGTKHLTSSPPLPPPPPTQTILSPEGKMLPVDFNIDWGRKGGGEEGGEGLSVKFFSECLAF